MFPNRPISPSHRRATQGALVLILLLALLAAPVWAQPETPPAADAAQEGVQPAQAAVPAAPADNNGATATLVASESRLVFRGNTGENLARTFTLKAVGGSVYDVRINSSDLLETTSDRAILASQVTANPAQIPALDSLQTVSVALTPGEARAGVYTGTLSIWYTRTPTATTPLTHPLTIALQVTLDERPAVAADANSVNQTLFGQTTDLPFIGTPISRTHPVLGELPITLLASSLSPAQVTAAEVLAVRNADGLILPDGVVQVRASLPLTIPGQGALTLPLVLSGKNLPAGSYTGSVRIQVAGQPTVIETPFNVKLKDNWLYAVLVLLASFVVGAAIAWYNNQGGAALKTIQEINRRQSQLDENRWRLAVAERNRASELLAAVMAARRNDDSQSAIDARVKAYDDYVEAAAKAIQELRQKLRDLAGQIVATQGAPGICQALEIRRAALLASIDAGTLASQAAGQRETKAIEDELAVLPGLQQAIAALPAEQQQEIDLATATSVAEVSQRLRNLLIGRVELRQRQLGGIGIGAGIREDLETKLADAMKTLKAPSAAELSQITGAIAALEQDVDALQKMQDAWDKISAAVQPMPDDVRTAATLADLGQALKRAQQQAGQGGQPSGINLAALSYGATGGAAAAVDPWQGLVAAIAGAPAATRATTTAQAWTAYTLRVQLGSLLVKGLVYLFALLVGWAALYLSNPTFGARPEDYIALFLWGATVNAIAGQQISLDSILGHKVQAIALPTQAGPADQANAGGGQPGGAVDPAAGGG